MRTVIEFGKHAGVIAFYAGVTSGIKRFDQSLQNMYSKQGMECCGVMMRKFYG